MGKRFHFDLHCLWKLLPDVEGVEAADLAEALTTAQDVVREMHNSGELPDSDESWQLLIRNEDGVVLATLQIE